MAQPFETKTPITITIKEDVALRQRVLSPEDFKGSLNFLLRVNKHGLSKKDDNGLRTLCK
jgi:hypothetical protein